MQRLHHAGAITLAALLAAAAGNSNNGAASGKVKLEPPVEDHPAQERATVVPMLCADFTLTPYSLSSSARPHLRGRPRHRLQHDRAGGTLAIAGCLDTLENAAPASNDWPVPRHRDQLPPL